MQQKLPMNNPKNITRLEMPLRSVFAASPEGLAAIVSLLTGKPVPASRPPVGGNFPVKIDTHRLPR